MSAVTVKAVERAFAALDLSDLNERMDAIDKRREDAQEAEKRAEERCAEITRIIQDWRGLDPGAIADALVEGDASQAASAGIDMTELEAERAKLREGIRELRRRANAAFDERTALQAEARLRAAPLPDSLIAEWHEEAEQAAQTLVRIWASATAIVRTVGGGDAGFLSREIQSAVAGLFTDQGILIKQRALSVEVPGEIVTMLKALQGKGPLLPSGVVMQVPSPPVPPMMSGL